MSSPEPSPGDVVGKYVIETVLGRGGMGAVFRARHQITDRTVALKWLLEDDESRRRRFLREAKAMGRLSHPNVVGVLDVGDHEGAIYLVMDYVEGESLREHMEGRVLEPQETVQLLLPAMSGVAAAHQAGILHRDLKPENLFVCKDRDGTPFDTKVLDFGVAKAFRDDSAAASLTQSGAIVGTPKYMAPEQLGEEQDLDPRCDVYALGLITFEMLTGQLPYRSTTLNKLFLEILTADLPRLTVLRDDLPEALAEVVARALQRDPTERWADVGAFARALEPFAAGAVFAAPRSVHTPDGEASGDALRAATGELMRGSRERPTIPERRARIKTGDQHADPTAPTMAESEIGGAPEATGVPASIAATGEVAAPGPRRGIWVGAALAVVAVLGLGVLVLGFGDRGSRAADEGGASSETLAQEALAQETLAQETLAAEPGAAEPGAAEPGAAEPGAADLSDPETGTDGSAVAEPSTDETEHPVGGDGEQAAPDDEPAQVAAPTTPSPRQASGSRGHRHRATAPSQDTSSPPPAAPAAPAPDPGPIRVETRAGVISADDF